MAVRTGRDAVKNGRVFVKHVVPAVIKPARTLWNEVIGFVFTVFAVTFGFRAGRMFLDYQVAPPENQPRELLGFVGLGCLALVMSYFAITSFLKARRIARS